MNMEIVHKKYGELTKHERSELFDFQLYNCNLPTGIASKDPEKDHGFVGIWDKKKLVAVGLYRPLIEGERVPEDTPEKAKRFGIKSLDVDEYHRGKGYGSKLLTEVVRGILTTAGGQVMIRMDHYPELTTRMKELGFNKQHMFNYRLFG